MSLLKKAVTSAAVEAATDSVGTSFAAWESNLYLCDVEDAYVEQKDSGAVCIHFNLKNEEGNTIKLTEYVMSGNEKGNKNTYTKDGKEHYLPGFNKANAISLMVADLELSELDDPEEKTINLYDYDLKKEVPTKVAMLTQLTDKKVCLGIVKQTVDKNVKNESTGKYEATGETREENEIDAVFHAEMNVTVVEARAGITEPAFQIAWKDKWAGVTKNKAKGASGSAAGAPAKAGAAAATTAAKPKKSLFG